jgi:hypothetical protein
VWCPRPPEGIAQALPLERFEQKEIFQNYENRVRIMKQTRTEEDAMATSSKNQ